MPAEWREVRVSRPQAVAALALRREAGALTLLANLTGYASPSYTAWTVSGELIVMVILGWAGTVIGPLVGALVLLLLEEWLASLTTHWMAPLGLSILLVVLLTRRGLYGAFLAWSRRHAP